MGFVFTALPLAVTAVTFAVFSVPGVGKKTPDNPHGMLTAAVAYTALSLFQVLRFPLLVVPMMITRLMDLIVINGRLTKFLRAPERAVTDVSSITPYSNFMPNDHGSVSPLSALDQHLADSTPAQAGTPAIEMVNCTFKWPEPEDDSKDKDGKKKGKNGGKKNGSTSSSRARSAPLSAADAAADNAAKAVLPPTLINISLSFNQGSLVGICGPVGCGKSSLLSAMVGDVPRIRGRVMTRGNMAICTQEVWITNNTLRNNILFGKPYDPTFYARVISACALDGDLPNLPGGDQTEIGERGVNLSGGQKARVALARACYARASVVLLDDVLSAVDAEVGAHLVSKCINGILKEMGALVVFITHHTHWLTDCDHVVQIQEGGVIKAQGPPSTIEGIMPRNPSSSSLGKLASRNASRNASGTALSALSSESTDGTANGSGGGSSGANGSEGNGNAPPPRLERMPSESTKKAAAVVNQGKDKAKGKMMTDEDRERGTVSKSVWMDYVRALGLWSVFGGMIGTSMISQTAQYGSSYWLGIWAGDKEGSVFHKVSGGQPWFYLAIFVALSVFAAVFILTRSIVGAYASVRAARVIHNDALQAVLASPTSFFDTTPVGRILNRFSGDVQKVDVQLASSLSSFIQYLATLVCTLAILILNSPFVLIAIPPLGVMYLFYSSYYRNSAREVQRLDSISRSPIYAAFSEALNGAMIIQAYKANARFEEENRRKVDSNLQANYVSLAANRWLTVRLEFFSNILLFLTALLAVVSALIAQKDSGAASRAAAAGLALTYAPGLTDTLNFLIRQFTTLETQMVSVERMNKYAQLEGEKTAPPILEPTAEWPSEGTIVFKDVRMGYRPGLPDVLKQCNFTVRAGEKIGIAGRTGAGKSSILVALYRLTDLREGSISIDGLDIAHVPLPKLRNRLGIIPQDPVLFTGTLRSNLDPLDAHTDEALWASLRKAGMEAAMAQHPEGLRRPIEEKGGNLSMGQRQLLCLCRALLKGARILVLDEATASVDMESDALIQETLQHAMGSTTVLTIAHRLETIMHCDRIIVMHDGYVAESGPPEELRGEVGGRFAELWEART
uniref:ATP-dependent transporter ycf16 n=1 Tax=Haptolina brevifila TaxID=156173 RepID=A0A7S2DAY2_9EUKA